MIQPAQQEGCPKPDTEPAATQYSLSEPAQQTPLHKLADKVKRLKEGPARLLTALAALTELEPHHSISISTRALCKAANLSPSALGTALRTLADLNWITIRHGSASRKNAYMVNIFTTQTASFGEAVKGQTASFGEAPTPPDLPLFESQPASFGEAVATEKKGNSTNADPLDKHYDQIPILDRVLTSKPGHYDQRSHAKAREWLHGYMVTLGTTPDAHPPDIFITAQFLAVADLPRLQSHLKELFAERLRPELSYAWFITTALQRIHGIHWTQTKAARAALRVVRTGAAKQEQPEPEQLNLSAEIATIATRKALR